MTKILFLCTGNSCRSQMAEGYARHFSNGAVKVRSAGIEVHGKNPMAIAMMAKDGIDICHQESTRLTIEMLDWADLVVTVCGHADDNCPAIPEGVEKVHWSLIDPARTKGNRKQVELKFREVRDEIKGRVKSLLKTSPNTKAAGLEPNRKMYY